jgi:oxalate decarboxylase/phosphoglucose isomerase-like protein (cupin superfamily)|tara:strand:+ start:1888 stop:2304 length:417 start_codon:yes stop_codon:yes gene_type:complete
MTKVKLIDLPKILDKRGNLSFFENKNQIPFDIKRTYWIYDVPGGQERGSHAFRKSHEFIVALSGSFDVVLNDGETEKKINLNRSYSGLYVPNLLWRKIENFSTNSLALIVSSIGYDEKDYIRDFEEFQKIKNEEEFCI